MNKTAWDWAVLSVETAVPLYLSTAFWSDNPMNGVRCKRVRGKKMNEPANSRLHFESIVNHLILCHSSRNLVSEVATYLYPYSRLSPHPPQSHSFFRSFGLFVLPQEQVDKRPSLQALDTEYETPAEAKAWAKAASLLPGTWI